MSPEYESLFRQQVEFRIVEARSPLIEEFIRENGLSPAKVVKCDPQSWCERKRCFVNVEEQVCRRGGAMETGWLFCEFRDRLLETEAHAVWLDWSGRRHDITPHKFQPQRVLFSPDPKVAAIRGYTVPYKKILSNDRRVRMIEEFDWEIERLIAERFRGFGREIVIPSSELIALGVNIGLPADVAEHLVTQRTRHSFEVAQKYQNEMTTEP